MSHHPGSFQSYKGVKAATCFYWLSREQIFSDPLRHPCFTRSSSILKLPLAPWYLPERVNNSEFPAYLTAFWSLHHGFSYHLYFNKLNSRARLYFQPPEKSLWFFKFYRDKSEFLFLALRHSCITREDQLPEYTLSPTAFLQSLYSCCPWVHSIPYSGFLAHGPFYILSSVSRTLTSTLQVMSSPWPFLSYGF